MADKIFDWQCPPNAESESRKLKWVDEQCEEGQSWIRTQRGYGDWKKSLDILSGRSDPLNIPMYRSQLQTGRLKRNVKEVIGACANIRPIWAYHTENPDYQEQAVMMNKVMRSIYMEQFLDAGIKKTLQWSATTCTGWLRPVYRRTMYGAGKGNLNFLSYGAASVLPFQLPSNGDWQEAYAVTLLDELPIAMAHGMFPKFQDRLQPTKSQFWYSPDVRTAAKGNLFQRVMGVFKRNDNALLSDLFVPIRYTYVIDLTLNKTDRPIQMGPWVVDPTTGKPTPGASWSYEVPALGSQIPVSRTKTGQVLTREANENDARLYPNRRLIISSEDVVLYDGPSFDWHGELPLIPFQLDDWAWEPLGFSLTRDGYNIQMAINEIDRGNMDKVRASLDMPLGYDINSVTKNEANMLDPMQPRSRIGFDGSLTQEPFKPIVPPEVLKVDIGSLQVRDILEKNMDYQLAINDIASLAKARALGSNADNLEKVMEADGPIVRDIARNMERGLSRVGNQCKYLILQFETTRRLMQYVGENGMTRMSFDYNPDSLIPSHIPDEYALDKESVHTSMQRAKWFADNLRFFILPHSVHEIAQMSFKLGLIQLRKAGIPIDSQTIAEAWNLELGANFKSATPYGRYWEEQEDLAEHAIKIKQMAEAIQMAGMDPTTAILQAVANSSQALGGKGGPPGGGNREGRPPSGQQPPRIVSKDGGARSAVSESGA